MSFSRSCKSSVDPINRIFPSEKFWQFYIHKRTKIISRLHNNAQYLYTESAPFKNYFDFLENEYKLRSLNF